MSKKYTSISHTHLHFILTRSFSKADYRAATIYLTFNHSPSSLSLMPNLRLVQLLTSGHDHMRNTPLLSDPSIPVSTCSGVSARSIAQYVVLSILSWAHQYPRVLNVMSEKTWAGPGNGPRGYPKATILAGKRVGIWGYGSIGRQGMQSHRIFFLFSTSMDH